jgi:hypothetical protein
MDGPIISSNKSMGFGAGQDRNGDLCGTFAAMQGATSNLY